jgi:hypothetical protein
MIVDIDAFFEDYSLLVLLVPTDDCTGKNFFFFLFFFCL